MTNLAPLQLRAERLSRREEPESGQMIEGEEDFFHYDPVFVAFAGGAVYPPSPSWNQLRQRHATTFTTLYGAVVFGPNFVGDRDGRCYCDSHLFRRGHFDFFNSSFRAVYPGPHPDAHVDEADDAAIVTWSEAALEQIIDIDEPVTLLTPIEPDNWARWVVQVAPKIALARRLNPGQKLFVRAEKPWQLAFLEKMGVGPGEIINHDPRRSYRFRRLSFFQHSASDLTVSRAERRVLRQFAGECRRAGRPHYPDRIFLSRLTTSLKTPHYRRLENETELLAAMVDLGFSVIEPELLPLDEQVRHLDAAGLVVALGGAGLFNAAFCRDEARVVTIESQPTFITSHTGFLASMNLWHGVIYGAPMAARAGDPHAPWTIDVDKVVEALRANFR
ncbi:MAG TPA: glycosyltransferase 61 family protein [Caulobacteraceae bacterium]|jgi:capsular polysaccharide biosynthesis protein|nr:glycosyltransferase 61 family protein [Caulobacteraceae bacterium]